MKKPFSVKRCKHPRYSWRVSYTIQEGPATRYKQKYFVTKGDAEDWIAEESPALAAAGPELGEITPEERRALSIWRQTLRDLEGKLTPPG